MKEDLTDNFKKQQNIIRINNYNKKFTKAYLIRINIKKDSDLIEKLNSVPSKMGYIKNLIRKDIEKNN